MSGVLFCFGSVVIHLLPERWQIIQNKVIRFILGMSTYSLLAIGKLVLATCYLWNIKLPN